MYKYLLNGILITGVLTVHSCFAKPRKNNQPAPVYVTATDDTIPDPLPLMDSINKRLVGTWDRVTEQKTLVMAGPNDRLFSHPVSWLTFTARKECMVKQSGGETDLFYFNATGKEIILDDHGCTGSFEQSYRWLNDSTIVFAVQDVWENKVVELAYRKVRE